MDLERVCKVLDIFRRLDKDAEVSVESLRIMRVRSKRLDPKHLASSEERDVTYFGFSWDATTKSWSVEL